MTTPTEPEMPWLRPTTELPAQPEPAGRRRLTFLLPVIGLLVLCCGGGALVNSVFRGGGSDKSGAPTLVVPSSSAAAPSPSASPSPTPSSPPTTRVSATAPAKPKPKTHKSKRPTAKPTTTRHRPTPTASATVPVIQQGVRPGTFCAPPGALGVTARGRVMRCGPSVDDPRDRWRPML